MTKARESADGRLLVEARRVLHDIYESCLRTGFHGRANGSRAEASPSPVPGSNIILANEYEVVVVYQKDKGCGPIALRIYRHDETDRPNQQLSNAIRQRLVEHGLLTSHSP